MTQLCLEANYALKTCHTKTSNKATTKYRNTNKYGTPWVQRKWSSDWSVSLWHATKVLYGLLSKTSGVRIHAKVRDAPKQTRPLVYLFYYCGDGVLTSDVKALYNFHFALHQRFLRLLQCCIVRTGTLVDSLPLKILPMWEKPIVEPLRLRYQYR